MKGIVFWVVVMMMAMIFWGCDSNPMEPENTQVTSTSVEGPIPTDTVTVFITDTLNITITDTIYVDSGESESTVVDTLFVTDTLNITAVDTLFVTDTLTVSDTTIVTVTDTFIEFVIDTVIVPTTWPPNQTGINEFIESISVVGSDCNSQWGGCEHKVLIRPLDPLKKLKINVSVAPFVEYESEITVEGNLDTYTGIWVWWNRPEFGSMNNVDLRWYWHTVEHNQYLKICVAEWIDYPVKSAVDENNGVCAILNSSDHLP